MRLHTGWLSPSAELIECGYMSHSITAEEIINRLHLKHGYEIRDDDFLLELGYVKIGKSLLGNQEYYILFEKSLTDLQIKYIQDILEKEKDLDAPFGYLTKFRLENEIGIGLIDYDE